MFLLPIFTLLIIKGIEDLQTQSVIPIVFTLLIQGFLSQKLGFENQWLLFLPIILAFIWFLVKRDKNVLIIGIMVGLFSIFYQNAKLNDGLQYQAQKQLSTFIFNQEENKAIILSYQVQCNIGQFYLHFDTTKNQYIPFSKISNTDSTSRYKQYFL